MWQLHWMINLIPHSFFIWITYLLFGLGIALYLISKLVVWIPLIAQYKFPVELLGVILLTVGAYLFGSHNNEMAWKSRITELEQQVKIAEEKSQQVNTVVQTKVITKVKVVKQNVYVNREIIKEVAGRQLDASCTLPVSTVVLHDSASRNEVAKGPGSTDGTPSTVKASELLDTVVVNYGTYYEVAEKLKGWQEWYRSQKAIFETLQK
jgi:Sec7-like guanine-nucleotide exchange factor